MNILTHRQRQNRLENNELLMAQQLEREVYQNALSKLQFDDENQFLIRLKMAKKAAELRKPAGSLSGRGQRYLSFEKQGDRRHFSVGNLAFFYHTEIVPESKIQHLDKDCDNQALENLRHDRPLHPFLRVWGYERDIWTVKMPSGKGSSPFDTREEAEAELEQFMKPFNLERFGAGYDANTGEVFDV